MRLYDKDLIGSDDDLGLVRVPLSTLRMNEPTLMSLPLQGGAAGPQGPMQTAARPHAWQSVLCVLCVQALGGRARCSCG